MLRAGAEQVEADKVARIGAMGQLEGLHARLMAGSEAGGREYRRRLDIYTKSEAVRSEAIELNRFVDLVVLRARIRLLSLAGGTNESRAALIADVRKQIQRPDLVAGLARALTATGQPGLARTLLEEGYAAQPDPRLTVMLVRRLIETGETDRATTLLDAASPYTADRPDLVSLRAELFRLRGSSAQVVPVSTPASPDILII